MARPRGRRRFGAVRKLPSGRYQARYRDHAGAAHTAPETFATKSGADRYLAAIETDMLRGTWRDRSLGEILLKDWAEQFMETKAILKPKTRASYVSLLNSRITPEFGNRSLASIRTSDVRRWQAAMTTAALSASRRRQALLLLSQIMEAAVVDGRILVNPCGPVTRPKLPAPVQDYLTADELDALAGAIKPEYKLLVYLLGYGGLRWGELAGLRRASCDLLHGRLVITEALAEVSGQLYWGDTKTHQQRSVSLPAFVVEMLESHLQSVGADSDALVFTSPSGQPLRYSNFYRREWLPAVERADLRRRGTHIGRRTAATLLLTQGADVKDVQAQLGHKDATMTLNVYCAPFEGKRDEIAARLDRAWRRARKTKRKGNRGAS